MTFLFRLTCLFLLASPALAQVDPGPDGIGVYFDTAGSITHATTNGPGQIVTAYLLLTRPSAASGVSGFDVGWDVQPAGALMRYEVCCGGLHVGEWDCAQVGFPRPVPWSPAVMLATFTLTVADPQTVVSFRLRPCVPSSIPGTPGCAAGDNPADIRPLHVSSGSYDLPVARINGESVVPLAGGSWGGIKGLYR